MLILRTSPASPFGRKVKIAAQVLGVMGQIEPVTADTTDPAHVLRTENPLGKIPTLVCKDGSTLFDSRVIVEYLDDLAGGGRIIPTERQEKFAQLRLQALADGLCDAALLMVYESRFREPAERSVSWVDNQASKVERALTSLETAPPVWSAQPRIGEIALACALGYLDLRLEGKWRAKHPRLVAWLDDFAARVPAFESTRFKG